MSVQPSFDPSINSKPQPEGSVFLKNISTLPVAKQVSLVIALAATLALAVGIVIWSQATNYGLLFGSMNPQDMTEVIQTLEQGQVSYRLDQTSGAILVPMDQVHALRLKLAAQGFPKQAVKGYQLLDIEQGYGISQFKELTRFHRALEGELAMSVASINSVRSARVMLGMPKRSVFVRRVQEPTASVVVQLHSGRSLDPQQVNAIVHLVSSSIPNLKTKNVTVVDQQGNLLTDDSRTTSSSTHMSLKQLEYTRTVENTLSGRIINLLSPILGGASNVRAQVTAELDFTQQEKTRENFDPDPAAIRSEQEIKEINRHEPAGGIPGSLTNQPPRAGLAPEESYNPGADPNVKNSKFQMTKNYEIDRTVSHVKTAVGSIRRLSVAVVVDDKLLTDEAGNLVRVPLTEQELSKYRQLVMDAVGLDEARGDTLSVVNAAFIQEVEDVFVAPQIWEQPWFWDVVKQILAGLAVLIIIFAVIRPMFRDLSKKEESFLEYPDEVAKDDESLENTDEISKALEKMNEGVEQAAEEIQETSQADQDLVDKVKKIVASDPKLAAHIIKQWLQEGV